jgi:hypothetical protein
MVGMGAKPADSMLTIPAVIHHAVMVLSPKEGRSRKGQ